MVTPFAEAWHADWLAKQLVAEFGGQTEDLVVAYRGNGRCVRDFEPTYLAPLSGEQPALRQSGIYLSTCV